VTNTKAYNNITDYPDEGELMDQIKKLQHHIALDADSLASELGSRRSSNIVMLGAASPFFSSLPFDAFKEGIRKIFSRKGEEVIEKNLRALEAGREFAEKNR